MRARLRMCPEPIWLAVPAVAPKRPAKFMTAHGGRAYESLDAMLRDDDVQVVCVCTPSGAHHDPTVQAARAGRHVVVEKPLEITLARCDAIIDACAASGVTLTTIFPSRFPRSRAHDETGGGGRPVRTADPGRGLCEVVPDADVL